MDLHTSTQAAPPPADVVRAALERTWLDWARTFLTARDLPGALNALRHGAVALEAHDLIHARQVAA